MGHSTYRHLAFTCLAWYLVPANICMVIKELPN